MKLERNTTHTLIMTDEEFGQLIKALAYLRPHLDNLGLSHRHITNAIIDLSEGWVEGVER